MIDGNYPATPLPTGRPQPRVLAKAYRVSVLQRQIYLGLVDRANNANTMGRPRYTSMFCIAYCKWENVKARLTGDEQKQYLRNGYSSVSWDMPTLEELHQFAEREATEALEAEQSFVYTGMTIGELERERRAPEITTANLLEHSRKIDPNAGDEPLRIILPG